MAKVTYEKQLTALLVIDPYNDFISEGRKVWDRLKAVAEANGCVHARRSRHNLPNYASAIVTTKEVGDAIASLQTQQ